MSATDQVTLIGRQVHQQWRAERVNWLVLTGIVLLLLVIIATLWGLLYLQSVERPYVEIRGYRFADEETFQQFLREGDNRARFAEFTTFLREADVDTALIPPRDLLRQGSDWLRIREPAFALPPRRDWPNIVATLQLVRDEVVPYTGPVVVVSAYRSARYNRKVGGSASSHHRDFCSVDLVPRSNISRRELTEELKAMHVRVGPQSRAGLGIYDGVRFHIDTCGYRHW
ncbi:D-Ala-D-Ala carboxypeptidase family metallohydrolase [Microbulbifer guangxiensis]|uniref:D-Ala-D-Ala carboxypeptidase family metallohydrolase n=1 Tax=Microbulbifer guangxiensis TaxID=2904249 RepID=UPI001F18D911|nr:D-Ala-D-Ala carboxypeptidase family metallohydrolase [Microbulbifer guangxiensis]